MTTYPDKPRGPVTIIVPPGVMTALYASPLAAEDFFAKRAYQASQRGDTRAAQEDERIVNMIKIARRRGGSSAVCFQEPGKPRFQLPAVMARPLTA